MAHDSGLILNKKKSISLLMQQQQNQNSSELGMYKSSNQQQYMSNLYASSMIEKNKGSYGDRLPITERKKSKLRGHNRYVNSSAEKTSDFMILNEIPDSQNNSKNTSLFLPKINGRLHHKNPTVPRMGGER